MILPLVLLLTQAPEVRAAVAATHLDVLAREYATSWCPPRLMPASFQGPDAYDQWVVYVAAHLRSGVAFGPDYPALAERARVLIYNTWFDCAKHEHDQYELDLRARTTPDGVGRALLAAFAGAPPERRVAAAEYFSQAAYPSG